MNRRNFIKATLAAGILPVTKSVYLATNYGLPKEYNLGSVDNYITFTPETATDIFESILDMFDRGAMQSTNVI